MNEIDDINIENAGAEEPQEAPKEQVEAPKADGNSDSPPAQQPLPTPKVEDLKGLTTPEYIERKRDFAYDKQTHFLEQYARHSKDGFSAADMEGIIGKAEERAKNTLAFSGLDPANYGQLVRGYTEEAVTERVATKNNQTVMSRQRQADMSSLARDIFGRQQSEVLLDDALSNYADMVGLDKETIRNEIPMDKLERQLLAYDSALKKGGARMERDESKPKTYEEQVKEITRQFDAYKG